MPTKPPTHRPPGHKPKEQVRKEYDRARAPDHAKTYNHEWRKLAKKFRAEHPLCAHCLAEGFITEAKEIDHIIPIENAPERRLDETNLQALCVSCHVKKTNKDKQ